jgi:hypothetical protein
VKSSTTTGRDCALTVIVQQRATTATNQVPRRVLTAKLLQLSAIK